MKHKFGTYFLILASLFSLPLTMCSSNSSSGTPFIVNIGSGISYGNGAPSNSDGQDGSIYIDLSTYDIYTKENGSWVLSGNLKGATGETGQDGSSFLSGYGAPDSSKGKDGDLYLDLNNWDIYTKSNGAWTLAGNIKGFIGDKGDKGDKGDTGQDGSSFLSGHGVPSSSYGHDGDTYLDVDTGDVYTKSNGFWTLVGNIKGLTGNTGDKGDKGDTGNDGFSFLSGHGGPSDTLGKDGDTYIDVDTWDYYVKSNGSWTKEGNLDNRYHTVTFDSNFGTPVESQKVKHLAKITKPETSRNGYHLNAWTYQGEAWSFVGYVVTEDMTLTAEWDPNIYNIHYNLNGGINNPNNPVTYTIEDNVTFYAPEKKGYSFLNWVKDDGNIIYSIPRGMMGDISLTATYEEETYHITYHLNDGINNPNNPSVYTMNSAITLFEPTKAGYTFNGWTLEDGSSITSIPSGTTGNIDLYANWSIVHYSISYDLQSGTNSVNNPTSYTVEDQFVLSPPTKEGYSFGCFKDETGHQVTGIVKGTTGDLKLTAYWNPITYGITYNLGGGTNNPNNPSTYTIEDDVSFLSPTRSGYDFKGWTDNNGNAVTSIEKGSVGNKEITANWEAHVYTITYSLNGGTNHYSNPTTYTVNDEFILLDPSRTGFTFTGWYDENNVRVTEIAKNTIGDKVLTARWLANAHQVTVTSSNDAYGSVSGGGTYSYGDNVSITATANENCSFLGWYDANDVLISKNASYSFVMDDLDYSFVAKFGGLEKGSKITIGEYPTDKVVDDSIIDQLNSAAGEMPTYEEGVLNPNNWVSYSDYYKNESMDSFMYYQDVELSNKKYHGVYLTSYRSSLITDPSSSYYSYQDDNGVLLNTTYWYEYNPVVWNVLDKSEEGVFLISDLILDSQDYQHTTVADKSGETTTYANNYESSYLRGWLNNTFYDMTFTSDEKASIVSHTYDNSASSTYTASGTNTYACPDTVDKVSVLSYADSINEDYGFAKEGSTYDVARQKKSTDYAKSQGLNVYTTEGYSYTDCSSYWLRSPNYNNGTSARAIYQSGNALNVKAVNTTSLGVLPVMWVQF